MNACVKEIFVLLKTKQFAALVTTLSIAEVTGRWQRATLPLGFIQNRYRIFIPSARDQSGH